MANYLQALEIPQWARETTAGTLITATSKIAAVDFLVQPQDAIDDPAILNGFAVASHGYEVVTKRSVNWSVPSTPVVFDQFQAWLGMALVGGVTSASGNIWTYTLPGTALPNNDTRTIEVRLTDGSNPSDWRFGYSSLEEIVISGADGKPAEFTAKGFARRIQSTTLTAALSLPTVLMSTFPNTSVYIDDLFSGVGGTQIVGQVLNWKLTIDTGLIPQFTADARTDFDFGVTVLDPTKRKAMLEVDILAQNAGQWATEKTKAEALTNRAVQIKLLNGADSLLLQGVYKHKPVASVFPDTVVNGQQVAKLMLESSTDQANYLKAVLTNATTSLG